MRTHPLVGRESELQVVDALVDELSHRSGALLLLTGEPGIGKTRLAEEVVARAAAAGARTAWTTSWHGEGAPALWPWSETLRQLGQSTGLLEQAVESADDAMAARFRQFERVAETLRTAAATTPLAVVFDDVQWTDAASLRLLAFAATSLRDSPCLLVATVRDAELPDDELDPLRRLGTTISLGGIGTVAVRELLSLTAGDAAAGAGDLVAARTGGNPLFVRELGQLLRASGRSELAAAAIPPAVAAVIERRLARLSDAVTSVLQAAAVTGKEFASTVVERVAIAVDPGLARDAAQTALNDAVRAGVLRRITVDRLAFAHDLVRDVVLETVPSSRRTDLHRAAAELHRSRLPADPTAHATVAMHLEAAGSDGLDDAAAHWEAAARHALDRLAYEQAASHFERALGAMPPDSVRRADLLLAGADARLRAGDLWEARARFVDAAGAARLAGQVDRFAAAVLGIGAGIAGWEVPMWDDRHVALLEEALSLVDESEPGLRAALLARLSVGRATPESLDISRRLAEEALDLARRADDPVVIAQALASLCDALASPRWAEERRRHAEKIVAAAEGAGEPALALLGRRFLIVALLEVGDLATVDREIGLFARQADRLHQPLVGWYVPLFRGMRALLHGRLDEADAFQREVSAAAERTGSQNAALLAVTLRLGIDEALGRPVSADAFDGIVDIDPALWSSYASGLAFVATLAGDRAAAATMLGLHATTGFVRIGDDSEHLATVVQFARAASFLDDRQALAQLYDLMVPHAGRWIVDGIAARCWGPVDLELARIAVALGHTDDAARHLDAARPALVRAGASLLLADADSLAAALGAPRPRGETPSPATTAAAPSVGREMTNEWHRDGEFWTLTFDGNTVRMKDAKGLADIARLVARPGRDVHVAELYGVPGTEREAPAGDLGDVLDARARAEYKTRLADLEDDLADAEAANDLARAERARGERDFLAAELAAALGLGGRPRRAGDPNERARKAVSTRIRLAIDRLDEPHPALARHLRHSIHTGAFCSYRPEHPTPWST